MNLFKGLKLKYFMVFSAVIGAVRSVPGFSATIPIAGTDIATEWDELYYWLLALSLFFFVGIVVAMVVFAVKYKKRKGVRPTYIEGHTGLEVVWTVIPTILVMVLFFWGWNVYKKMITAPSDAIEIRVVGKQWLWQFVYPNGSNTIGDLFVPVNKPVKLIMSSEDVLHSFFIPNFRVKSDVVPGMYSSIWFEAKHEGLHQIFCTEYCGTAHSGMLGRLVALKETDWLKFLKGDKIDVDALPADPTFPGFRANQLGEGVKKPGENPTSGQISLAEKGKKLVQSQGCVACHSSDGVKGVGPSYKGLYGTKRKVLEGDKEVEVLADDTYIMKSIYEPNSQTVVGYPKGQMPVYKGLLNDAQVAEVVEYLKTLK